GSQSVVQSGNGLDYICIPSDRFYESALQRVDASANVQLRRGIAVNSIQSHNDKVQVDCGTQVFTADYVVDTRPPQPSRTLGMTQQFLGREIVADRACFDPQVVGLMTDMSVDDLGLRFTYVLPFSERHALVEETRFATSRVPIDRLESGLEHSLFRLTQGGQFTTVRDEMGAIPMGFEPVRDASYERIINAGTAGGAVRASSGYAFARIQRWADECVEAIRTHGQPIGHARDPLWLRSADALFLRVLRVQPELAPRIFMAMGRYLSATTLVRFLSDDARPTDFVQVASVLPKRPFLRELALTIGERVKP
ncbi:MAG: lycopene cyclase family protein, partial [Pseudomonadota bacterium]